MQDQILYQGTDRSPQPDYTESGNQWNERDWGEMWKDKDTVRTEHAG